MARFSDFRGMRFVGNPSDKIVHDILVGELYFGRECHDTLINLKRFKLFTPDTLTQAKQEGFRPCPLCMWNQ